MVVTFPSIYPDELLYSTIARYHQCSGNKLFCQTQEDLFGERRGRSSVVMPLRLGYLAEQTKPFGMTFDDLIGMTLFPYFMAFQTDETIQEVCQLERENKPASISAKLGAIGTTELNPRFLRFCPQCYAEDQKRYGEGYWYQLHQTPGLLVCDRHHCQLLETTIPYYDSKSNAYEAAVPTTLFPAVCPELLSPLGRQQAVLIAKDIRYLYENYDRIRAAFTKHESSFCNLFLYLLRKKGLATEGSSLRHQQYREQFCGFFDTDLLNRLGLSFDDTVARPWIISMCRHSRTGFHPLRYILLARFLCGGLPRLIELAEELSKEDLIIQTKKRGQVTDFEKKLEKYREKWLDACTAMPGACQNDIRKIAGATYTWLYRHDKDWLMEHPKERKAVGGNCTYADRTERDRRYAAMVPAAAEKLRNLPRKPIWITKTRLTKELDLLPRFLEDLPLTKSAIDREIEDRMGHRLRKLAWAERELSVCGEAVSKWKLMKLAGIRDEDWDICWEAYIEIKSKKMGGSYGNDTYSIMAVSGR